MAEEDNIPHFDVDVLPDTLQEDFRTILENIKPTWKYEDVLFEKSALEVSRGLLNTMVKCYDKNEPSDAIMIRVHNPKMAVWINRKIEVACIKYFMKMDCAPKILATFKTGFCYEFIHGEILNSQRIGEDPIWKGIAEEFAKFHSANIEDEELFPKISRLQDRLDEVWSKYPTDFPDPEKDRFFKQQMPSKEELQAEVNVIVEQCLKLNSPLVLCHNDTRGENIIWNADLGVVKFVDFEAMNYAFQAGEIASHFTRYCGMTPPDYSLLPTEEFQKKFLRHYLEKHNQYSGKQVEVTDQDVHKLYVQVKKFHLFYLLMSALGGPIMEAMNIIDSKQFNLLEFAVISLKEYYKLKDEILSLAVPQ